jgi:hypothetical protein
MTSDYDLIRLAIHIALFLGALVIGTHILRPRVLSAALVFGCVCGLAGYLLIAPVFQQPLPWIYPVCTMSGLAAWAFIESLIRWRGMFSASGYLGMQDVDGVAPVAHQPPYRGA